MCCQNSSTHTPVSQGADETGVPGAPCGLDGWTKLSCARPLVLIPLPLPLPLHSPCCACHPADAGMMRITGRQAGHNRRTDAAESQTGQDKKNGAAVRRRGSSGPLGLSWITEYSLCCLLACFPFSPFLQPRVHGRGAQRPFVLCCGRRSLSPPGAFSSLSPLRVWSRRRGGQPTRGEY